MNHTYEIPDSDDAAFAALPVGCQVEIRELLRIFWRIDHAPRTQRLTAWSTELARAGAAMAARGIPAQFTLKTLYARRRQFHLAGRDWVVLVDRRRVPDWDPVERRQVAQGGSDLPDETVEYLRGLAQRHARSSAQAIEELYREWRAGRPIPGYGTWAEWFAREYPQEPLPAAAPLPEAWSRRHLRRFMPRRAELAAARRGVAAAVTELPTIIRTRVGLRPLEYVVFDDWRADFQVFVPGVKEPCDFNGILGMDVACALPLRFGARPAVPREDGAHDGLKRIDTKSLFVDLLLQYGYPLDYVMNVIVENGTATISRADAQAIEDVTGGRVRIHYTSMISGTVFGWADQPLGNFRGKAWLESFINLLHNACGNIQGQIGAHYDKRPRQIPARAAELQALVKAESALPAHLRDTLNYRMPFPHVAEGLRALNFVFHFLSHREQHACEGFEQILKVRLSELDPWRPVMDLLAQGIPREALMALQPRPFLETPAERWKRLCRDVRFQKLQPAYAPQLLTEHRQVTVEREGEVNLGSKSDPLWYRDRANGHLVPGRRFIAYTSTTDDSVVHLVEGGRYITSVSKVRALAFTDTEGLAAEMAAKGRQLKETIKRVQARDLNAPARLADVEHNLQLAEAQLERQALAPVGGDGSPTESRCGAAAHAIRPCSLADTLAAADAGAGERRERRRADEAAVIRDLADNHRRRVASGEETDTYELGQ